MIKQKKGISALILFLIILILIIVGFGIYFWISGGSSPEVSSEDDRSIRENIPTPIENIPVTIGKIPTPPVLPD